MTTQLVIRTIDDADTQTLAELTTDIQRIHHQALPHHFKPVGEDISEFTAYIEQRIQSGSGYIAELDSQVVGTVLFELREVTDNPYVYSHTYLHIDQMGVRPAYRGRGIGQELMKKAIAYAKKHSAKYITLNVWDFNDGAINFYENMGFDVRYLQMQKTLRKPE